jgi:alcohol dehydrogenase
MTSRYALFHGPGQPLQVEQAGVPELAPGEVLVSIDLCTLCGSDVHTYQGDRQVPCPTVLGHEMVGRLVAVGGDQPLRDVNGQTIKPGDRLTWSITASCGECFFCRDGLPQKCTELYKYGHQLHDPGHPLSGGLADQCQLVRGTTLIKVPEELDDAVVAPASCATATVAGACRVAGIGDGMTVLIQGAGMLGLTAVAMARQLGAREVLASDLDPARLARAEQFGATRTLLATDREELEAVVRSVSEQDGVDVVLELSGSPAACEQGLAQLRTGGVMVLVGTVFPTDPFAVDPETVVRRCLKIEGLHNYCPIDLVRAISFLEQCNCQQELGALVEQVFPLSEVEAAFQAAQDGGLYRVGVAPGGD